MAVRLFIGNLPYSASEAHLRAHLAPVAEPTHVAMPVNRETGRPRGFAFVEFPDRETAEAVIQKFDQQPFQGRNLAVSEARARQDRGPRPPRPPGSGYGGPRPVGAAGYGGRPSSPPAGSRDRSANFGPPAPPRRLRNARKNQQHEHRPRGPIKERTGGRIYDVADMGEDEPLDMDNFATRAPDAAPLDDETQD